MLCPVCAVGVLHETAREVRGGRYLVNTLCPTCGSDFSDEALC